MRKLGEFWTKFECLAAYVGLFAALGSSFALAGPAGEIPQTHGESETLTNIRQLTSPAMGFKKAGEAYFSPNASAVIFQAAPKGEKYYQIYTISVESGAVPKMVSTGRGACTCGYFRPDGKKIIFASSHTDPRIDDPTIQIPMPGYKREGSRYQWDFNPFMEIYQANTDGSDLKSLTNKQGYDAEGGYSRDGRMIAFASNRDGNMNIYTMQADGSNVRQITHEKNSYNGGPFFSPDGKRIVFRADRQKRDYLQLYVVNADGTNESQLTDNEHVNWAPYWHPNGKCILYTTSEHGHRNYEVYLMNVDTRAKHRITNSPRFDGLPVFSNDGKKMMWTSQRGPDGSSQVFIADFVLPAGFN